MTIKDAIKTVELCGTKINQQKLAAAIKRDPSKDFVFAKETVSGYSLVLVKLG